MFGKMASARLSIRWKILLPFVLLVSLVLLVLLPIINTLATRRIEQDADRRLGRDAESVAELLERSAADVLLKADLAATLPQTEAAAGYPDLLAQALSPLKQKYDLQELSFYGVDFEPGDAAIYYGGPVTARRFQLSRHTTEVRESLILQVLASGESASGIALAPQSSQILGVVPVLSRGTGETGISGVVLAASYLDNQSISQISNIVKADIAVIRDNAVVVSTIATATGYEAELKEGLIDPDGDIVARNLREVDGVRLRVLSFPLELDGQVQGTLLVTQPIHDLLAVQNDIRLILFAFSGVVALTSLIVGLGAIFSFARPLRSLAEAARLVSSGRLEHRVAVSRNFFRDEITELGENFNGMTERLQELYTGLERKVEERTQDLVNERNKLDTLSRQLAVARDQALEANRAKSMFLANMSHELRTPLNAIIGYTELVLSGVYGPVTEKQIDRLDRVKSNGQHLLNLISDVLDLSKIEAGKMELYLENFQVYSLVDNVINTARPLMLKNSNTLEANLPAEMGMIVADQTKVQQVLFNLLSNAAKFTENGTVTLTVERQIEKNTEWIYFRVTDSGIGMTPEQTEKVFEEFMQADASTTRKYGGTGLGLAICRRFCQMMGGSIEAQSEVGKGSVFTMRLPVDVRKATEAKLPSDGEDGEKEPEVASQKPNTVLVIDDNEYARDLLSHYLQENNFNVVAARNGEEGLQLAEKLKPSIITLDVMMPEMDGWTVLTTLKANAELSHIPVIIVTILHEKNKGYSLGASDYITKPIDRTRFGEILQKYQLGDGPYEILIVEDEDDTRRLMRDMLEGQGWTVSEAPNGREALHALDRGTPNLILLDLMMPEMDGFEFMDVLRKHNSHKQIPVIVVTAMTLSNDDRKRLNGYVTQILQKGTVSQDQLLAEIRDLVNTSLKI